MQTNLQQNIHNIIEILYRKTDGADDYFNQAIKQSPDEPMLHILRCIMLFFSFSNKTIVDGFPQHIDALEVMQLDENCALYYQALQAILRGDFLTAFSFFARSVQLSATDHLSIVMLETLAFIGGFYEKLTPIYQRLLQQPENRRDPDFLVMVAFLYCHTHRLKDARELVFSALKMTPHNAWAQHVYAHTLDETVPVEREQGIQFMLQHQHDWPKQNRFFQGHNWMHTCVLMLRNGTPFANLQDDYAEHIWGEAKAFSFEQNNAFLVLWTAELLGCQVPQRLWDDLAGYACPFSDDYFTPYLTMTAILAVAKSHKYRKQAQRAVVQFQHYAQALPQGSMQRSAWHDTALPILQGMLAYSLGDLSVMQQQPCALYQEQRTKLLGHSDEQRSIFLATYQQIQMASEA